jgi:hypothetical protein
MPRRKRAAEPKQQSREERKRDREWQAIVERTNERLWRANLPPLGKAAGHIGTEGNGNDFQ